MQYAHSVVEVCPIIKLLVTSGQVRSSDISTNRILNISRVRAHERPKVLSASLARWWGETSEFLLLTRDIDVPDGEDDQATNKVVEGIEIVEPVSPERRDV